MPKFVFTRKATCAMVALWLTLRVPSSPELRLAAAGWLGGFGNPPLPPPPLAGWLAGAPLENSQNT